MKQYICSYATDKYAYALPNLGRRIAACISYANIKKGEFVLISDKSENIKTLGEEYIKNSLPKGWSYHLIQADLDDRKIGNYKTSSQLLIAQLQTLAFTYCRKNNAKYVWSVESDVLPSINSLRCLIDAIKFDNGFYSVAMATYPSQGGGSYLGGGGSPTRHIESDYTLEERLVPKSLSKKINTLEKSLDVLQQKVVTGKLTEKEWEKLQTGRQTISDLYKDAEKYPPKDNVFALNGKKWKKRGWMDAAYPAIGLGAMLPTDWVGLGNTMMNKKALEYAIFDGYEGFGTQDLYLGWQRWIPAGIKMCVLPHCASDHIIRERDKESDQDYKKVLAINAYHQLGGEMSGHLRQRPSRHYNFTPGEKPIEPPQSIDEEDVD